MRTISDPLNRAAEMHGDKLAFVCDEKRTTFSEFITRCQKVGSLLDELDIGTGERVGLLASNSDVYAELYCGVPAAGRTVVPLNGRWAEPELAYALEDAGAKLLITDQDPGVLGKSVKRVLSLSEYEDLLSPLNPKEFATTEEDDLAGLFYTGGTTGQSKGVMLTHRNLIANTLHSQITMPLSDRDTYLVVAPMFHAAGSNSVLQCLALGICQVIVPTFDPDLCLDLIETHKCSATLAVPTMVAALVEAQFSRPRDTSSMTLISHGASPIATQILVRAHEEFPNAELLHLYGATETAPLVTGLRHEEELIGTDRGKSVGRPSLGVSLRIDAASGQAGEVLVKGPNVMQGYWNKPEQTAAALENGWYRTGDIGYLDEDGYLFLVDRAKDMIISGGENVYCSEVEEVIYQHPKVLEATVFGVPNAQWGEQVHAVVVPREDSLTEEELIDFCRASLGGYKLPRSVEFRSEELPKSGPGKVLKRELRAPYWEGKDRAIN